MVYSMSIQCNNVQLHSSHAQNGVHHRLAFPHLQRALHPDLHAFAASGLFIHFGL